MTKVGLRGRPKAEVRLSPDDRRALEALVADSPEGPKSMAVRARIVLLAGAGTNNDKIAEQLGTNQSTVVKWRKRYLQRGIAGLRDDPRSGAPRTISDKKVQQVVWRTLTSSPRGSSVWSSRELAAALSVSPSSVVRIWDMYGLKPWLSGQLEPFSGDEQSGQPYDLAGVLIAPPDYAFAVYGDGPQAGRTAQQRAAPSKSVAAGQPDVTELLAGLAACVRDSPSELAQGNRLSPLLRKFVNEIDAAIPAEQLVHILIAGGAFDAARRHVQRSPNFSAHRAPSVAVWLHEVQRRIVALATGPQSRAGTRTLLDLSRQLLEHAESETSAGVPLLWTKSSQAVLASRMKYWRHS
jgi:transposase